MKLRVHLAFPIARIDQRIGSQPDGDVQRSNVLMATSASWPCVSDGVDRVSAVSVDRRDGGPCACSNDAMPRAYVIVDMDVTDPDRYAAYRELAGPAVEAAGGRYLARGGATEVLEGDRQPHRMVILEFPDMDAARAWYGSPAYVEARGVREGAAVGSFVAVEGV